jgi:gluconate 2-dehydrogenase subunit 3-like protein
VTLDRREMLKLAASVAVARRIARGEAFAAAPAAASVPRFFTPHERALFDAIAEAIIPADGHSPGAHAAGVAAYVDAQLAEKGEAIPEWAEERKAARAHLLALDALSRETNGKGFLEASAAARAAVLRKASANETSPETAAEKAFEWIKGETVGAYYTSKIGLHQEMEYKGNTAIIEFVGEVHK